MVLEITIALVLIDKATKQLNATINNVVHLGARLEKLNKQLMGIGFAALFGGMALNRAFGGALRSLFNTYTQIIDVHDEFFQRTQSLRAAWEFLKFSIMDALGQSDLFAAIIGGLVTIADWIGQLPEDTRELIGLFILLGLAVSFVLMPLGQLALALIGLAAGFYLVEIGVLPLITFVFLLVLLLGTLFIIWNSGNTEVEKGLNKLIVIVAILTVLAALAGAPFAIVLALILILLVVVYIFRDELILGFKEIGLWAERIWLHILITFNKMIVGAMKLWNKFIKIFGLETIFGVDVKPLEMERFKLEGQLGKNELRARQLREEYEEKRKLKEQDNESLSELIAKKVSEYMPPAVEEGTTNALTKNQIIVDVGRG